MTLCNRMLFCSVSILGLNVALALPAQAADATTATSLAKVELEEVVVTAEKRATRSLDVAGGISAVSGDKLADLNETSFADYLGRLPGVVFNAGPEGDATAIIRGIGTTAGLDQGQGPTGYFINDIPLTEPGYAVSIPDLDNFDVSRIEVMRGPQGTLFGSSSLGGAINYIANLADPSGYHAAFAPSISSTDHDNGQVGYAFNGMVNIPIIQDQLAVRGTGYYRSEPGYIDNIGTGEKATNKLYVGGGRISVVWQPDAGTTVSWLSLYQNSENPDFGYATPALGSLTKTSLMAEKFNTSFTMHSLKLEHDFGFASLTAIGAYNRKTIDMVNDYTVFYSGVGGIADPTPYEEFGKSKNTFAELRLTSPKSEVFDWVFGVNYQDTDKSINDQLTSADTPTVIGSNSTLSPYIDGDKFYWGMSHVGGMEAAIFGEAHLHFFDGFTATFGGRYYYDRVKSNVGYYGVFYIPPFAPDAALTDQNGFAPKFSLSYDISADSKVYVLASKGYRFGSPNTIYPLAGFDTPAGSKTDTLWNYEAGYKALLFDRSVSIDADVFYVDWSNIQVRLYRPDSVTYGTNAGGARSYGLEFAGNWRVNEALSLGVNFTYLSAELNESVTNTSTPLLKGMVLPGAAKYQVSDTIAYNFGGDYQPTITLQHSYISHAPGSLSQPQYRVYGYDRFDVLFSVQIRPDTSATVFAENLGNAHAATFTYGDYGIGLQEFIIRPRTVGLRLNWQQ
jgi:iron complex outermembrane recepter protein